MSLPIEIPIEICDFVYKTSGCWRGAAQRLRSVHVPSSPHSKRCWRRGTRHSWLTPWPQTKWKLLRKPENHRRRFFGATVVAFSKNFAKKTNLIWIWYGSTVSKLKTCWNCWFLNRLICSHDVFKSNFAESAIDIPSIIAVKTKKKMFQTNTYLDLPRGAEWIIRGAGQHHSLGWKKTAPQLVLKTTNQLLIDFTLSSITWHTSIGFKEKHHPNLFIFFPGCQEPYKSCKNFTNHAWWPWGKQT